MIKKVVCFFSLLALMLLAKTYAQPNDNQARFEPVSQHAFVNKK